MEHLQPQEDPKSIFFDSLCIQHLASTRKWTKFLSFIGFLFLIYITIVVALICLQFFNSSKSAFAVLPMFLLGLIYFFPIYYLCQFSYQSKIAIERHDSEALGKAMKFLNRHYVFMGLLVVLVLFLYVVVGIGIFASGGMFNLLNGFKL